jgi:IS5 family transposase
MQLIFSIARERLADAPLMKLGDLVQWADVEQHMQADYWRAAFRKGGRVPYDHRAMFRALLIARWYGLTFPALEHALRVRLDFLLFCGFDGNAKLPDASTLSRFRSRLVEGGKLAVMFEEVDRQLSAQGVALNAAHCALVDLKLCATSGDSKMRTGATLGATEK